MTDAWKILGLDPDTADEKQVRSAYARLLKLNRPDQNPEGFQQLRHAYEHALQWLRHRNAPADAEDEPEEPGDEVAHVPSASAQSALSTPPPQQPAPVESLPGLRAMEVEWPREWSYALEAVKTALQKVETHGPAQAETHLRPALSALAFDARDQGIPPAVLVVMIETIFAGRFHLFASAVPELLLLHLIHGGANSMVRRVLDHYGSPGTSPRMAALATSLVGLHSEWADEANADIAFRIATSIAFHRPTLAQQFKQKLAQQLDPARHAAEFDHLFGLICRGLMYRDLPAELRRFWSERLATGSLNCHWDSDLARSALADAVRRGPAWSGFQTTKALVPPTVWETVWRHRHWHRFTGLLGSAAKNVGKLPEGTAIAVIVLTILGLQHCSKQTPRIHTLPPPKYEHEDRSGDELQRSLNEILKKATPLTP